jgi:hypothetical protein
MTEIRRNAILNLLKESENPLTGSCLAQKFKVSRQVIVQDIAVLRASGHPIIAALSGYYIQQQTEVKLLKTFVSCHTGLNQMEDELQIVVDYGGKMLNIAVSHPLYGDIVCPLKIQSREDIREFLLRLNDQKATPLSSLTEGIHYHTIEVDREETFEKIIKQLKAKGFIPQ